MIQLATAAEIEIVRTMISETSRWLRDRGIYQWSDPIPLSTVANEVVNDELYILRNRSGGAGTLHSDTIPVPSLSATAILGTFVLTARPGELWPDPQTPALYFERLAVIREAAGQNLGAHALQFAVDQVQQRGLANLRLTCDASNKFLRSYYEKFGFKLVQTKKYDAYNMIFALYEKEISSGHTDS